MASVVTSTITTVTANSSSLMIRLLMPTDAAIRPTSPREIMPMPIWMASRLVAPPRRAPSPLPSSFEITATAHTASVNQISCAPSSRASVRSPMLAKKIGTKNA